MSPYREPIEQPPAEAPQPTNHSWLRRLKNYALAVHQNGVGISYLVTLTPLAYPATVLLSAALVTGMFILDPEEFDYTDET